MMDHNEYDIIRSPSNHATFKRAPSLPRLRNKASLGRLQVFGGVLDFDDEGGRSANSSSMDYIPPIPVLSHLYCSNLAGPVHSSSIHHTHTTPTESHNNKQQTEGEDEELQHTPVKNTNTLSALKAVKAMNRQDKYPSSLSNGLPPSSSSSAATIPRLDFDHPQGQSQSEIRHKQEQSRCNINIINGHSRSSSSRRTSQHHYKNASSLDSFSDESSATGANVGEGRRRRITRPSLSSQDEIEEKENLVNEINKDMDEGGYASLEQILARNGFKVCRVATPPSSGRISSSINRSSAITGHTGNIINSDQTGPSQGDTRSDSNNHNNKKKNNNSSAANSIIHPLSKFISNSSSGTNSMTASTSNITTTTIEQTGSLKTTGTFIKNKTSMLSFSGFVSSLWSSNTSRHNNQQGYPPPSSSSSNSINKDLYTTQQQQSAQDPTIDSSNMNKGENDESIDTPGAGCHSKTNEVDYIVDRNEEIKGWLEQSFIASNIYMNEARKTIEAARIAMGSPEKKKKITISMKNDEMQMKSNKPSDENRGEIADDDDDDVSDPDLPVSVSKERRQATTSTLESSILETPTCSPINIPHHHHHHETSTIVEPIIENRIIVGKQQKSNIPPTTTLYSPPLRQLNQMEPIINDQVTYFDSPLMRKKMKRISAQVRQEYHQISTTSSSLSSSSSQKDDVGKEIIQYPPPPCRNKVITENDVYDFNGVSMNVVGLDCDEETGNKKQIKKTKANSSSSAENLLRGTLRHAAISEAALKDTLASRTFSDKARKEQREERDPYHHENNVKKLDNNDSNRGVHRPSIATIFGIPIGFSTSVSSINTGMIKAGPSSSSSTSPAVEIPKHKEQEEKACNSLQESTTESLSSAPSVSPSLQSQISNTSTSAKDNTTTSSSLKTASITTSSSNSNNNHNVVITAPKLLRKTASKHTLRKAASPILSNSIVVLRDEDIMTQSKHNDDAVATPVKFKKIGTFSMIPNSDVSRDDDDTTPVKNKTSTTTIRGPMPLIKSPALNKGVAGGESVEHSDRQRKNVSPRQISHRNPRDSPVGETKVVRSAPPPSVTAGISKRFSPSSFSSNNEQQQGTPIKKSYSNLKQNNGKEKIGSYHISSYASGKPSIMDNENDDDGLWSPPKFSSTSKRVGRAPLGAISASHNNSTSTGGNQSNESKPRLKAKESLERLLAYKEMKKDKNNDDSNDNNLENVPPVPTIPASVHPQVLSNNDQKTEHVIQGNKATIATGVELSLKTDSSNTGDEGSKVSKHGNAITRKASFTGTLRGLIGSAVAGWADSTPILTGDRVAPIISSPSSSSTSSSSTSNCPSSARRVTILPAQQQPSPLTSITNNNNNNSSNMRDGNYKNSMRRVKSMYIEGKNSNTMEGKQSRRSGSIERKGKGIGSSSSSSSSSSSWIAMERNNSGNSLILPTIIISDYTHE